MKAVKNLLLLTFMLLSSLAFSAQPNKAERQAAVDAHPEWPEMAKTAIVNRQVLVGMTMEQVMATWGSPFRVIDGKAPGYPEFWTFRNERSAGDDRVWVVAFNPFDLTVGATFSGSLDEAVKYIENTELEITQLIERRAREEQERIAAEQERLRLEQQKENRRQALIGGLVILAGAAAIIAAGANGHQAQPPPVYQPPPAYYYSAPAQQYDPFIAENGSYRGELNEELRPKRVYVEPYYRNDGARVRSHYRAKPRR